MAVYPAIFFEDGNYIGVKFPDLPGCFSQGNNFEEAKISASKALGCYLDDIPPENYPAPSKNLDAFYISADFNYGDSHEKLFNESTEKTVVIPMNCQFLGEKLQQKIKLLAGTS